MKTNPGMAARALVLVVATALVTWLIVRALGSCANYPVYDNLNDGFYSLVINVKKGAVTEAQATKLQSTLAGLKNGAKEDKLAFCFNYNPEIINKPWHDGYPNTGECPVENSPTTHPGNNINMSVLSHKIYSVRACDIEQVIDAIK